MFGLMIYGIDTLGDAPLLISSLPSTGDDWVKETPLEDDDWIKEVTTT